MSVTARHLNPGDSWKCECGEWRQLGTYVLAHWDTRLTHTCKKCGAQHGVLKGTVILKKAEKKS